MILSMTGYGKAEHSFDNKNISVEIKTLNTKNIDLKIRIPVNYKEKEMPIRKLLSNQLKRGKIDVSITVDDLEEKPKNNINTKILKAYLEQLKTIKPDADETQLLVASLRLPDVLQPEQEVINEAEWQAVKHTLQQAVDKVNKYRRDEGAALEKDLRIRIQDIQKGLENIKKLDGERLIKIKNKLKEALDKLQIEVDNNRFEQELIYYLEKFDINEEKVRLQNHLQYFLKELEAGYEMKGKKLGFISQEIGREINTIGSKANDSNIQQEVVKMKDALEKIKEQVLNIL